MTSPRPEPIEWKPEQDIYNCLIGNRVLESRAICEIAIPDLVHATLWITLSDDQRIAYVNSFKLDYSVSPSYWLPVALDYAQRFPSG